ncbi:MAG: tRNA guanosine(34) transglycosylase Tgt [Dehalococcoidia bacterium]
MTIEFRTTAVDEGPTAARAGVLSTARGDVLTPAFMPVGTLATVKSLLPEEVRATGAGILLVNAYHLYLRPGADRIASLGGVHRFMDWPGPILSDSGGFQVFSLANLRKLTDEGVVFRSHIDGSEHSYTPELAIEVQRQLGVDIAMPLDHVVPGSTAASPARDAAERTLRWFDRSQTAAADGPAVFAIVQGGIDPGLRRWHARELVARDAPGYAIGGLSVGESKDDMHAMLDVVTPELPAQKPRYLMGVGSPEDLVNGVARGIDMFDCVLPTRLGRNGALFTRTGRINIANARFADDPNPPDPGCDCLCCDRFSAAYLHHLFRNDELLGYRLATIHNLRSLARLCEQMRVAIESGEFGSFRRAFLSGYRTADETTRKDQHARFRARSRATES